MYITFHSRDSDVVAFGGWWVGDAMIVPLTCAIIVHGYSPQLCIKAEYIVGLVFLLFLLL